MKQGDLTIARRAVLCALAGVGITVVVAASLSLIRRSDWKSWYLRDEKNVYGAPDHWLLTSESRSFGSVELAWQMPGNFSDFQTVFISPNVQHVFQGYVPLTMEHMKRIGRALPLEQPGLVRCSGWPFVCMRYYVRAEWRSGTRALVVSQGIPIDVPGTVSSLRQLDTYKFRAVPLGVMWNGFLANSAIYGVALFGLTWGMRRTRRRARERRGACGACGYLLAGCHYAMCPECGHTSELGRSRLCHTARTVPSDFEGFTQ